jgi:hypothetical protein
MNKQLIIILATIFLNGCVSFENFHEYGGVETTNITLSAPNISAQHAPPLIAGVAYVSVYDKNIFCQKRQTLFGKTHKIGEPIGKIFAFKKQRTTSGVIPTGQVIVKAGLSSGSVGDGNVSCGNYFTFRAKSSHDYEIEVKEGRPFVTQCFLTVKEKNKSGEYSIPEHLKFGVKPNFFQDLDVTEICDLQNQLTNASNLTP